MKTVLKSLFLGVPTAIAILCLIGTTIWQYIEYDRELEYYKIQERWYEAIYVGDKYKIKNKSIDDISSFIQDTKCNINNISHLLPMEGYFNVYKLVNKFESICALNNIRLELLEIKASSKVSFDEIEIHCNLKGSTEGIHNSLNG
jgi:hypothetical protein